MPNGLSTSNLAARWNLAYKTLYKWRLKGWEPKFHKMGTRVVYDLDEVERFEERTRCRSTSEYPLKALEEAAASKKKPLNQVIPFAKKRK